MESEYFLSRKHVFSCCALVLFLAQLGLWQVSGKHHLDDAAYDNSLRNYLTELDSRDDPEGPKFFVAFLDATEELSQETLHSSRALLGEEGMKLLDPNNDTGNLVVGCCAAIKLETRVNSPAIAIVDIAYSNANPLSFHFGYSELYISVLGGWRRLFRFDQWAN